MVRCIDRGLCVTNCGAVSSSGCMNTSTPLDPLAESRKTIQGFGRHYDYDVSYLEELMDASSEAFRAFEAAMPMARIQKAASTEDIYIAKIAGMRGRECGPKRHRNVCEADHPM